MDYHKFIIPFLFSILMMFSCSKPHNEEDHEHEEENHHAMSGLIFEPEQASEFGIEYETIEPGPFYDVIKTSGMIEASPSDIYTITAKKSGIISLANGISQGSAVKSGEHIGSISSTGIQGGDVNQAAIVNLQSAKSEYERLKPLYEEGLVTASTFREAERVYREAQALAGKGKSSDISSLSSPLQGNIQNLYVKSGDFVDVGSPIAVVAKNSNQILRAELPSRESRHLAELESANFIPEGSTELLKLKDLNGKKISGNTSLVSSNGYIPVVFSFSGNSLSSPSGYAEVFLICGERPNVISIPRQGLVEIQGNKYVYVFNGDHSYEKKLVKTGASDGERVEITEGLNLGDKVVSKGASILRMAEVSSIAPPAHTHNH